MRIRDEQYAGPGALLGGVLGAVAGLGFSTGFNSTRAAKERTRAVLGISAGLLAGIGAGYIIGSMFADSDIVIAQPDSDDYNYMRQYACYPDTLPLSLELLKDSLNSSNSLLTK